MGNVRKNCHAENPVYILLCLSIEANRRTLWARTELVHKYFLIKIAICQKIKN